MRMLDKLKAQAPDLVPANRSMAAWSAESTPFENPRSRPPVSDSEELRRVHALPRRPVADLEGVTGEALVELMTKRFSRGVRKCACQRRHLDRLLPAQAWALYEAPQVGGLLAPIGVGQGKTILNILMPMAMKSRVAVLLIPPNLRSQLHDTYLEVREHFHVPSFVFEDKTYTVSGRPIVHVVPYSRFSRPQSTALLRQYMPDLILADEAHRLRNLGAASTSRFMRYFSEFPTTRFCGWSGTITGKSLKDYAHLSALALGTGSPLPIDPMIVEEWSGAIDPNDFPGPAGALRVFCDMSETLYDGFRRRLVETPGVVTTKAGAAAASVNIYERKAPAMPSHLAAMLDEVRRKEKRPDGEELVDQLAVAKCARELACGFFYRWKFPRGEPVALIEEWFAARKKWFSELREKLLQREEHMDSYFLCSAAAERAERGYKGDLPVWHAETWADWARIKDQVEHESEAVWKDDYLAKDAAEWAKTTRGIVWYEHDAFGQRVAELSGLPLHKGGQRAEELILAEKGDRSLIVSIKAHGTGRDGLQRLFSKQLVANPPASGDMWEQLLGRLNRIGQAADEVDTYVYRHTLEMANAIDRAVLQAKYVQGTLGANQILLAAACDFDFKG